MMHDYYDTLGCILRDRLDTDDDPFLQALEKKQGKYRTAANKIERRIPTEVSHTDEPVRVPVPDNLIEDFAVLQLLPGMPLDYCKQSWKRLLKKYHPDIAAERHTESEAADIVRRITRSYRRIESWFNTGKIADDIL
ncbi:MAG: J domain-containing protein [Treponema sp.]